MDHVTRLQMLARATYYLGWLAAICGALVHFNVAMKLFVKIGLPQRNLLEAAVVLFLISMASALRALALMGSSGVSSVKKQAA